MKSMRSGAMLFVLVIAFLVAAATAWGQVEDELAINDVPIFPNALIILDTSGSMAEVPYRTESGKAVPVGTRRWNEDIVVDSTGTPVYDDGNLKWTSGVDRSDDPFAVDADPNVFLTGGNHPASKLYKAKLALNNVLPEVDSVNLGFATFMQLRMPRVKSLYYRQNGEKYEFRWLITIGMLGEELYPEGRAGHINLDTCHVTPEPAFPYNADQVVTDSVMLSPNIPPWDPPTEVRCAPIPMSTSTVPALPSTPKLGGASMSDNWFLLTKKLENVKLGDGSVVNAYPKSFDYSLIWYPNPPASPEEKYPHSWSYARMVLGGDGYGTRDWSKNHRRVPYYPDDAESPAGNYLGREFVPGTEPETDPPVDSIPELSNYFGDDHLAFVHLPDPTNDDNPSTAQAHRDKILSFLSLKRQTDPTFDCRVAPTSGGTGCEFCPNGKSEGPYRQFTSMPFTSSVACGGYSPIGQALTNAKDYYLSYFDQDQESRDKCRDNCVILFTDGRSNCFNNNLNFNDEDPAKVAAELNNLVWHEGKQGAVKIPVKTYVIGFGLDEDSKKLADEIAKAGGTEHAYLAINTKELELALRTILGLKDEGLYSRSDPVLVGKETVYTGFFELPFWAGHLKKYTLVEEWWRHGPEEWYEEDLTWYDGGTAGTSGDFSDGDAGAKLDATDGGSRTIFTTDFSKGDGDKRVWFTEGNVGSETVMESEVLKTTDFADGAELVSFIRDMESFKDADGKPLKSSKLGDIYHSTPVVVGKPISEELDSFAGRDHLVLVGANDGMVHSFDAGDGTELWAYIPPCVLGNLHKLKNGHIYGVDLDIKAADVEFDSGWRTILMGGLRQGGNHYFALDITDTTDPVPLWEVTDEEMGQTWSTPSFGRIPGEQYVAFVGGGYDPDNGKGSSFYVIDLQTGAIAKKFIGFADSDEYFPAQVQAVDLDRDGYIERVYFVGTKGKLYRLCIDPKTGVENDVTMIFDPGNYNTYGATEEIAGFDEEQSITRIVPYGSALPVDSTTMRRPVYHAPAVMRTEHLPRNHLIHYGTGDEKAVLTDTTQDYFFEIEDRGTDAVCRMVYVFDGGEKCLSRPTTFDHVVYFTTFAPGMCGSGEGYVYGLTVTSRLKPPGDGAIKYNLHGERLSAKKCRLGGIEGIPSSPQVVNGAVIGNSSRNPTGLWKLKIDELRDRIRSWQEVF